MPVNIHITSLSRRRKKTAQNHLTLERLIGRSSHPLDMEMLIGRSAFSAVQSLLRISFVLLEHIRSQMSLTLESSLKLANIQSANFVVKQNAQLFVVFRKVHIGISKICLPKLINYLKKMF